MYPYFVVLSLLFNEHKYSRSSVQRKKKDTPLCFCTFDLTQIEHVFELRYMELS